MASPLFSIFTFCFFVFFCCIHLAYYYNASKLLYFLTLEAPITNVENFMFYLLFRGAISC